MPDRPAGRAAGRGTPPRGASLLHRAGTEPGGKHTDHQHGLVLAAAVELDAAGYALFIIHCGASMTGTEPARRGRREARAKAVPSVTGLQ